MPIAKNQIADYLTNEAKINNSRKFSVPYHTGLQYVDNVAEYITTSESKKIINSVEGSNNVDFVLTNIGDIGDTFYVENDGTGIVRVIGAASETFIGEGNTNQNFEGLENAVTIPQYSSIAAVKKKANLWRINGIYNTSNVDITAPTVVSATVSPANTSSLTVVFDKAVTITNVTGLSLTGAISDLTINSITSGSGTNTIVFALSGAVVESDTGTFVYGATNTIKNLFDVPLATSSISITNNIVEALYEGFNAADPVNEINGVANTTTDANSTVVSSSEQAHQGTYSVKCTKTSANSNNVFFPLQNVSNGDSVTLTCYVYRTLGNGGNVFVSLNSNYGWDVTDFYGIGFDETGVWQEVVLTATATQDEPLLRVNDASTATGNIFYVDNISYIIN